MGEAYINVASNELAARCLRKYYNHMQRNKEIWNPPGCTPYEMVNCHSYRDGVRLLCFLFYRVYISAETMPSSETINDEYLNKTIPKVKLKTKYQR